VGVSAMCCEVWTELDASNVQASLSNELSRPDEVGKEDQAKGGHAFDVFFNS